MIYQLTNALLIPKLVAMTAGVPGSNQLALREMMVKSIRRKDARIFVADKEGKVLGFMFSSVEEFQGQDVIFTQAAVVLPGDQENLCHQLLAKTIAWGKELGLKMQVFITERNSRGFARKYKFRFRAAILERSL